MMSLDPVPVRWMALECIHHKKFSASSDVWAYGVLCWEVYSAGSIPYGELSPGQIVAFLAQGRRLARPQCMPLALYDIVLWTWAADPVGRPGPPELEHRLMQLSWDAPTTEEVTGYTLPDVQVEQFRPPFPWQHVTLAATKQFTGQVNSKQKDKQPINEKTGKGEDKRHITILLKCICLYIFIN